MIVHPTPIPFSPSKCQALEKEIISLLEKRAVRVLSANYVETRSGFMLTFFVVPKKEAGISCAPTHGSFSIGAYSTGSLYFRLSTLLGKRT